MKMKKTKMTAIITTFALMLSAFMLMAIPLRAQETQEGGSIPLPSGVTPDFRVKTHAYISARPNPVGVDQTFLVNLWLTPATHVSRYLSDYTVTITKPSGAQDVVKVDSYRADATAWFEYIANEVGEWRLQFDFPGGYFPAGDYTVYGGAWIGPQIVTFDGSSYYEPSSALELTLTVQAETVLSWPYGDIPSDYWERPVSPENRGWWPILGYFPSTGVTGGGPLWNELYPDTNKYMNADYDFVPWVQGPNTAHLVWKRTNDIGGLIGGVAGQLSWTAGGNQPSIIYAGRCYDGVTSIIDGEATSVWQCYDLRTGEVYWERIIDTGAPNFIMFEEGAGEVPGADPMAGRNIFLCTFSGGNLIRYNPATGSVSQNISIAPLSSGDYYGDNKFLTVQNLGGGNRRLIEWTIVMEERARLQFIPTFTVLNNVSWPWSNLGASQDFESMIAFNVGAIQPPEVGAWYGITIAAADMRTGQELWSKEIEDDRYFSSSTAVADHGKGAVAMSDGYWLCWDLRTGNQVWKSEIVDIPWGIWWPYSVSSAYGMIIDGSYAGMYAFDWDDGSIVWHYAHPTEFEYETPYVLSDGTAVYSFRDNQVIADGKVYTRNTEHTATQPLTRGWSTHCIDVFTGEGIWNITGYGDVDAIADGYLVVDADFFGQTWVIGKGKSATTVTAPDIAVPKGTAITIKGTVLDQSPAQPGTPCVSAASMSTWMEYLHMQRPIGGLKGDEEIIGVPVMLSAVNEAGQHIEIGTTTSNGYYGTFSHSWTPPDEGKFEIIASFAGDDSYGSSSAATAVTVGPAPAADVTPGPGEEPVHPMFSTEALIVIAVIAVAAIAIIAYLVMRKPKQ